MGAEGAKWSIFITGIISLSIFIAFIGFLIYNKWLYKLIIVNRYVDVFRLGKLWYWGLFIVFIFEFLIGIFWGLTNVPEKNFFIIFQIVGYAFVFAVFTGIFYWIFTLISSPEKIKYVPPGRDKIVELERILKGGD